MQQLKLLKLSNFILNAKLPMQIYARYILYGPTYFIFSLIIRYQNKS